MKRTQNYPVNLERHALYQFFHILQASCLPQKIYHTIIVFNLWDEPKALHSFDFSNNKFTGEIPRFIENLKALCSLKFFLQHTGCIPSSSSNLSELQSLDLSSNRLSGEIPQQLTRLAFLQSFDVSHNDLTGMIPHTNQLRTFENTSFEGNPGLCGIPLTKHYEDSKALLLPHSVVKKDSDSGSLIELDWKFVLAGAISGFVVGVALGDMVITKKQQLFCKAFKRTPLRWEIRPHEN